MRFCANDKKTYFFVKKTTNKSQQNSTNPLKKVFLYDIVGEEKDNIESIFLYEQLDKLSKDELILLRKRYFLDKTQSEIAKEMGVNQVKVSREEQKILRKLSENYQNLSKIA